MNVLVDRHQADLYYALQLIFEDGLGLTTYTPIGYEWFDEGFWQFGYQHMGRELADQYLRIDGRYEARDGYYVTFDPAHPQREIRCVTLAQFRALGWEYVVATVQDNQRGFRRLADESGARYVLQVGNTRQEVDWSLDPLALVSSEVPIDGRGVRIHQPFDAFRYHEPTDPTRIASFVNLMPRIHDWWVVLELQGLLPAHTWAFYGIDCPDGNLHPVEAIADVMAASGWGIHLKPTGDGFGHVIHGWAATGRPLIGRSGYYTGQLAERFWQDGVTCVDIDKHSIEESARLIAEISADADRYAAMSRAIRAEYEKIDWPAEMRSIRDFLGVREMAVAA